MAPSVLKLLAPISGRVLPLDRVPDPVFAQRMVGDGTAIDPTSQDLLAPCDGVVVQLHSAHHAITLENSGVQILMHIGLDTVKLKGEGFKPHVKVGDRVKSGQKLISFDADLIASKAKSLITLIIITGDLTVRALPLDLAVANRDFIMDVDLPSSTQNKVETQTTQKAESEVIKVDLPTGLHARPAALIVNLAKTFASRIELQVKGRTANAKSVVGILGLEIARHDLVQFRAEGPDAQKAVHDLAEFLKNLEEKAEHLPKPIAPRPSGPRPSDGSTFFGVGVSGGLAIGRVQQIRSQKFKLSEASIKSVSEEKSILNQALKQAMHELQDLVNQIKKKADASRAAIFAAHHELLEDPDILDLATTLMDQGKSAPFAWNQAIESHADRLSQLNNELMANRANDLRDVGRRVLRLMVGEGEAQMPQNGSEIILIAENLTPSETVQIDREKVFAFCTTSGGATSHVAILARSLGLPAIAGMDPKILDIADGSEVILDGDRGEIRLNPSAEDKELIKRQQREQLEKRQSALKLAHQPALIQDGRRIEVAANIGSVADAQKAVEMGADGVGLLRSEFLFMERATPPSEDEQYQIYQQISDVLGERPLVIRTLDVGGDKPLQYLPLGAEDNPFLGIRGIRVGLLHESILRDQVRAILRVRTRGKIHVMFPMVAAIEEFRQAKAILEEERLKMKAPPVQVGIMIEVPSAALIADTFAKEVDFFSIGTNDLTQYTLAMDRGHKDLAKQADALHPAVLRLIEMTCKAAKVHGKWVGVCGGLAGDLKAVAILIGLGVEELSVSIPTIPLVKSQVRETSESSAALAARSALAAESAPAVRDLSQTRTQS